MSIVTDIFFINNEQNSFCYPLKTKHLGTLTPQSKTWSYLTVTFHSLRRLAWILTYLSSWQETCLSWKSFLVHRAFYFFKVNFTRDTEIQTCGNGGIPLSNRFESEKMLFLVWQCLPTCQSECFSASVISYLLMAAESSIRCLLPKWQCAGSLVLGMT